MSIYKPAPCPCGSGLDSYWVSDARGIPMARTCDKCHAERMKGFRADVITNPNYWADEAIEEDA